jgi:hydroxyacylglutathione hydrolase
MILIKKIPGEGWICNSYIIHNGNDAIIIDPGSEYSVIQEHLSGLNLKAILCTHGHYDHIVNVSKLQKDYGIPFYIHKDDSKLVKHANLYIKLFNSDQIIKIPKIDYLLEDNNNLNLNFVEISVIHTPGHTEGSVCFLILDNLFTGDLLLKNKIGRTDFPGGDLKKVKASIRMLKARFEDVNIFPGHFQNTTLRHELENNKKLIEIINE